MIISSQKFSFCIWQSFTINFFVTICSILFAQQALAQVSDDFSDGDFTASPNWSGDDTKFTIDNHRLRLNAAPLSGTAWLSTPNQAVTDAVWEFRARMEFNPSSGNFIRVYLVSDNPLLGGDLNGYFVVIGDTADEISLYRQTGSEQTRIIDGENGRVNTAVADVSIRVTRDVAGNWQLFSDVGQSGTYISEGFCVDNVHRTSTTFGIYCVYTSTRSSAFYFDDILVQGTPFIDTEPPVLQTLEVTSANEIRLVFSEDLSSADTENFTVSESGSPTEAGILKDKKTIELKFTQAFTSGKTHTLAAHGVKDLAGNEMIATQRDFVFIEFEPASWRDLIITEIFPDPAPSIGLPEFEFVEIYNRSEKIFEMDGWSLTDGSSLATMPSKLLRPGEYILITSDQGLQDYASIENVVGLAGFPSLNNSGDILVLKDSDNKVIDSVTYSDSWYHDDEKRDGGWSLELIDPSSICGEGDNWSAAESESGGTPGKVNSIVAGKPDVTGPKLISVVPLSPSLIRVRFSEKLENENPPPASFEIRPRFPVRSSSFSDASLTAIDLLLNGHLDPGITYSILVSGIRDCTGNTIQHDYSAIDFGLPGEADSLDVLVNEVLFNPRPTGIDFVEIYNNSNKYLNLKNWSLATIEEGRIRNSKVITSTDLLLEPGAYRVLTENVDIVKGEYLSSLEDNLMEMAGVPAMNDDEGNVALVTGDGKLIDWFRFSDDFHSPFIKMDEGVSLERVSFSAGTNNPENWSSASSVSGYATPGYLNSASRTELISGNELVIVPRVFAPASGGAEFSQISYKFEQNGFIGSIRIIDAYGRSVKEIANNELLGTEGFYRWDGDRDDGTKARVGYYMVLFEVFDNTGQTRVLTRSVAIAGRF